MKKNISLAHTLLLLPLLAPSALLSMEDENKKAFLEESVIVVPEPTKRGFGIYRASYDLIWNEEDNLFNDVQHKKFDINNSSYHRKLDAAVEIFVEKENAEKLAELFVLCRINYPKQIKIGDSQALIAHKFFIKKNKAKQTCIKDAIQKTDKTYLEKQNKLLAKAKQDMMETMALMQLIYKDHQEEKSKLITHECDEIRKMKTASINLHKLNKTFKLPENELDGYCSDNEKDMKDPENIKNSYNDETILQKIKIADKIKQTNENINMLFFHINDLMSKLNAIQPLQY